MTNTPKPTSSNPRISWRDTFDTWPDLRVVLRFLPWTWRLGWWHDEDMTTSFRLDLGPVGIEWWANRPIFAVGKGRSASVGDQANNAQGEQR